MRRLAPLVLLLSCTPSTPHDAPQAAVVETPAAAPTPEVPVAPVPESTPEVATPTPTPEVAKPTPRRRDAKLHIAYPRGDIGWTVDIIDLDAETITAAITAMEAKADDDDVPDMLPPDSPAIPRGWKVGDTWTLVTRDAVLQRRVSGFMVSGGASEAHFEVVLGGAKTPATLAALAIRGSDVDDALRFRKPAKSDIAVLGDDAVAAVRKAVVDAVDAEHRDLFQTARIAKRHIAVYDGRFPGGRTAVVVLDAPPAKAEGDEVTTRASAILMRHDDGQLELVKTADVEGWIRLHAILDVDGDGNDEVFFEDAYYEGAYEMVIQWKDGAPRFRSLSGDGA